MDCDTAPEARGIPSPALLTREHSRKRTPGQWPVAALLSAWLTGVAGADAAELAPWTGGAKPALEFDALDGGSLGLGSQSGRTVLVHFFATWCEPCIEEMAALERLAVRRRAEPFSILAVDVGEVDARVRSFVERHPVGFPILMDRDRTATRAWEVIALPTSFVLDASHAVVLFAEGDVAWDAPAANFALDALIETPPGGNRQDNGKREVDDNDEPA